MHASYSGHFEMDDGRLIPAPMEQHPALRGEIAKTVRRSEREEVRVAILENSYVKSFEEASTADAMPYRQLTFIRQTAVATDLDGQRWWWHVWIDQYGRAVAGPRRHDG